MGVITHSITTNEIDLHNFVPEHYSCPGCGERIQRHITQEGVRYHVTYWAGSGSYCSAKDCERNHACRKNN
ncbi:MAG: hypothetical protein KKE05_01585 [Nanoarchaeota archaeon]|nr:hypothetical protein [Nanoarchaeota archaeon]